MPRLAAPTIRTRRKPRSVRAARNTRSARTIRSAAASSESTVSHLARRKGSLSGASAKRRPNSRTNTAQIAVPNTSSGREEPQASSATAWASQAKLRIRRGISASRWLLVG